MRWLRHTATKCPYAENLEFELAAEIRDRVRELEEAHMKLGGV
ncbi:MAG: hypothetical protein CMF60_04165 [Magnetococcales bacterium]|nr:hypothetical protein [Magnetococcales bacterium]